MLWTVRHSGRFFGVPIGLQMTVVRFANGKLWLHSPVPLTPELIRELRAIGDPAWIVAPNRSHRLHAEPCRRAFSDATLFVAPGLGEKRPDLAPFVVLGEAIPGDWAAELDQLCVRGMPV
jgi:hypothetical protein